jgi:hypothetical protein
VIAAPGRPPLPLDPLTPADEALAQRLARDDAKVKEWAPNGRLIYVQFISVKRPGPDGRVPDEPTNRYADVLLHNDEQKYGVRVLVDLTVSRVVDVLKVSEPLTDVGSSDVELAAGLALSNSTVLKLLGPAARTFRVATTAINRETMNQNLILGVRTVGSSPDDRCTIHRCVVLFFRSNNRYLLMNQVTVDLTDRQVDVARPGVQTESTPEMHP